MNPTIKIQAEIETEQKIHKDMANSINQRIRYAKEHGARISTKVKMIQ